MALSVPHVSGYHDPSLHLFKVLSETNPSYMYECWFGTRRPPLDMCKSHTVDFCFGWIYHWHPLACEGYVGWEEWKQISSNSYSQIELQSFTSSISRVFIKKHMRWTVLKPPAGSGSLPTQLLKDRLDQVFLVYWFKKFSYVTWSLWKEMILISLINLFLV